MDETEQVDFEDDDQSDGDSHSDLRPIIVNADNSLAIEADETANIREPGHAFSHPAMACSEAEKSERPSSDDLTDSHREKR